MKIVVTTPTGRVGSRVAQLLVQAGVRPVLLARDAGRIDAGVRERAEVVAIDLEDAEDVVVATRGADALYWVNPSTGADDPVDGYARLGAVGARAVTENGIHRVVFQSSGGAEARHGFGEIDGLGRTEELLDATAASVTHLRCGYFFTNLLMDLDSLRAGVLTTTLPVEHRMPWVDPRDIAEVAVGRLLSTGWRGRTVQGVYGPRDLSFAQVAETITRVTGHRVVAQEVPEESVAAALRGVGMTPAQVEGILGMSRGVRGGLATESPRDVLSTTPSELAAWAQVKLAPLLS